MTDDRPLVKFIRLKTGDDIICEVVTTAIESEDKKETWYTVINPLKVSYIKSELIGYLQISFIPWVFPKICDFQEFTIRDEDVLFITEVAEKMNNYYWENLHTYIGESKEPEQEYEPEPEIGDEAESLNEITDQLGTKRTFH